MGARDVYPMNFSFYIVIACAMTLLFWWLPQAVDSHTRWDLVALVASVATVLALPLLPSRGSDAAAFTMDHLPENEGYDERLLRTREAFADRYELTARQAEVFGLLMRGMKGQAIAGELGLSVWTVKGYITDIYAKTGVHSYKELMLLVSNGQPSS